MTRILLVAAVLCGAVATPWAAGLAQSPSTDPARRYADCMATARADPKRGIEIARAWESAGGGAGARHCRAIALFELGDHVEAGKQLETLAREMTGQSNALRAEIFAQAGQAYQAARLGEQALAAQNAAILLNSQNPEIWIDRSITYAAVGAYREAVSDLTHALALSPGRGDALVLRAAAWRQLGNFKAAVTDADAALRANSNASDALLERGMARRALRDRNGSDADLRKVLSLVSDSSQQAAQARAGLAAPLGPPPSASAPPPAPRKPAEKPK
ncbi:tetratricopeptide repeat protein [Vineibacter terrae]|nr:tetratricopeptide repeat protein [Vineibacter terrae]